MFVFSFLISNNRAHNAWTNIDPKTVTQVVVCTEFWNNIAFTLSGSTLLSTAYKHYPYKTDTSNLSEGVLKPAFIWLRFTTGMTTIVRIEWT